MADGADYDDRNTADADRDTADAERNTADADRDHQHTRSEWKLTLHSRITYRHYRQPKLPNFLHSSNHLFCIRAADAGNAAPTFCVSVPAISKLTTLTVESLWAASTETPHLGD